MYKFQFFVGNLRSLPAKNLINSVKLKKQVLAVFCSLFLKFCFYELTSLTCSFQNVSYSCPISKNLMDGYCLLIKRSPGQYIIYLTYFNKRRITITNNFYIWSISLLGYIYAEIYGKHKFIQIIFLIWRQSFVKFK